ncbi:MAG: class I SAM-dependent methyltransferase [Thaumarchaeota archaeon]|nr:class I SAM-dependent methyltransferase [Nitrososphaerota archaeon]
MFNFRKKKQIYNSDKYWKNEGKQYFTNYIKMPELIIKRYDAQADLIIKFIKDLKFASICEAGCGFGRITEKISKTFQIPKEKYLAFDISEDQIKKARELSDHCAQFKTSSILELQTDSKFDLVLASEVLMHIPHEKIKENISKLVNLSSKYVVNIDWKETDSSKSSFCNFAHDYKKIYESLGLKVKTFLLDDYAELEDKINQTLYLAEIQ